MTTTQTVHASASPGRLLRHYIEMVVAMFVGMAVLGPPAGWAMSAAGTSWSQLSDDAPALMLLAMAAVMTVAMVGWMAVRGHDARAGAEMSASMFAPTFAVIALMWAGLVQDVGVLVTLQHVAMLLAMLGVMVMRPAAYVHEHGRTPADSREVAA